MRQLLPSFTDEMTKIAVNVGLSAFRQNRKGRRPIRVQKMLDNEKAREGKDDETSEEAKDMETEGGGGLSDEHGAAA